MSFIKQKLHDFFLNIFFILFLFPSELSGAGLDPYTDYITIPNLPLWTGLNALKGMSGMEKDIGRELVTRSVEKKFPSKTLQKVKNSKVNKINFCNKHIKMKI